MLSKLLSKLDEPALRAHPSLSSTTPDAVQPSIIFLQPRCSLHQLAARKRLVQLNGITPSLPLTCVPAYMLMYAPLHNQCSEEPSEPSVATIEVQEASPPPAHIEMAPTKERSRNEGRIAAGSGHHGFVKKGGRPVTWIGGGGMDPKRLVSMGVPQLRALFADVFGEATASNNAAWLRRKLSEAPDANYGQGRCATVRARDASAAIWNQHGHVLPMRAFSHPNGSALGTHTHLDGSPTASHSSSGDGVGASCHASGRRRTVKRSLSLDQEAFSSGSGGRCSHNGSGGRRTLITRQTFDDRHLGGNVEVYWPDDDSWWAATVLQVDVVEPRMQLLYSNLQQEDIYGQDLWDMITDGHLAEGCAVRARPAKHASRRKIDSAGGSSTSSPAAKRHAAGGSNGSYSGADAAAVAVVVGGQDAWDSSLKRTSSTADTCTEDHHMLQWQKPQTSLADFSGGADGLVKEEDDMGNDPMDWLAEFSAQQGTLVPGTSGQARAPAAQVQAAATAAPANAPAMLPPASGSGYCGLANSLGAAPAAGGAAVPASLPVPLVGIFQQQQLQAGSGGAVLPAALQPAALGNPWHPAAGLPAMAAAAANGVDMAQLHQLLALQYAVPAVAGGGGAAAAMAAAAAAGMASPSFWASTLGLAQAAPVQAPLGPQQVLVAGAQASAPALHPLASWNGAQGMTSSVPERTQSAPDTGVVAEGAQLLRYSSLPNKPWSTVPMAAAGSAANAAEGVAAAVPVMSIGLTFDHSLQKVDQGVQLRGCGGSASAGSLPRSGVEELLPTAGSLLVQAAGSPVMDGGVMGEPEDGPPTGDHVQYISGEDATEGAYAPLQPSSSDPSSYEDDLDSLLSKPANGVYDMGLELSGVEPGRFGNNGVMTDNGLMADLFDM